MSADSNISQQPWIQRNILWLAGTFFLGSLALYFFSFSGPLSQEQGTWGEFGDYMGGVVNPIVGLCTIWLLTVSLKQNQIALQQAREELGLAREALEKTQVMQEKTEAALNRQVEIAEQTRDMANAVAVYNHLSDRMRGVIQSIDKLKHAKSPSDNLAFYLRRKHDLTAMSLKLSEILEKEAARLAAIYSEDANSP